MEQDWPGGRVVETLVDSYFGPQLHGTICYCGNMVIHFAVAYASEKQNLSGPEDRCFASGDQLLREAMKQLKADATLKKVNPVALSRTEQVDWSELQGETRLWRDKASRLWFGAKFPDVQA